MASLASFAAGLKPELIHRTAVPLLVLRVVEGLACWVLFNEAVAARLAQPWLFHGAFLLYFSINLFSALRYAGGRISPGLVGVDVVANLLPLALVLATATALTAPVAVVLFARVAGYALVFGAECGLLAVVVGAGSLVIAVSAVHEGRLVDLSAVPLPRGPFAALLGWMVGAVGVGDAAYAMWQAGVVDRRLWHELAHLREVAERERSSAIVTGALLSVSEAVSRLTRLDDILATVVKVAPRVLAVDYCSIFLWREDSGVYVGAAAAGLEADIANRFRSMRLGPDEVPDLEWVRRLGHCAIVSPSNAEPYGVSEVPLLIAPLQSGGQFFGVMQVARRRGGQPFKGGDLKLADGVARQTAVALERARLGEQSRRLLRALESTGDAVLITDARRRIRFINTAFLHTFGYRHEELTDRDASMLTGALPAEWLDTVARAVSANQGWRGEAIARRRDGSEFPLLLDASLIRDEQDRILGAVAILRDITNEKTVQEQLRRADRLAASGEMAAGIAHEVNNALVGILAQTQLAHRDAGADDLRTALGRVEGQGRRIASIVQALLGFARPQPPSREPHELPGLVAETLALLDHDLRRHHVEVALDWQPVLPPVLIDAKQIEQVLVNLVTNAVQAMASRPTPVAAAAPRANTLRVRGTVDGDRVRLDISDSGPGIPREQLERIFDPFFTTKPTGSGLGLSVSYGIVQAHGGELTAWSEADHGTTFSLTLPRAPRAALPGFHSALVVDDEDQVAEALMTMLHHEGLAARRVATGTEALAVLAVESFDVVLLDVRLPDITGPEVYARLRETASAMADRVVFVTGGLWRAESPLRQQLPPQPTLSKPCTGAQLREALQALSTRRAA